MFVFNKLQDFMPSTVLCIIDFSHTSGQALKWSAGITRSLNARLTVLYSYRLLQTKNDDVMAAKKKTEVQALENFSRLERDVLKGLDIEYDFRIEIGFLSDRIQSYAKKQTLTLIVIERSLLSGNQELTLQLVDYVHVPLTIFP
jgi:hypothetical protein